MQLKEAYSEEKLFWSQKARTTWLQEGDKNTQYFHAVVKGRRKRNKIQSLHRDDGSWTKNEGEIGKEVAKYYERLFTSSGHTNNNDILEEIPVTITEKMNDNLIKPVEEYEIKEAIFNMNPHKALGPDGMTPLFFQTFWDVVKQDVISAINSFFHSGRMLKAMNHTVISLIPKSATPWTLSIIDP